MAKIVRDAALVLGAVALAATGYGLAVDATVGLGGSAMIAGVATTTISSVAGFSAALAGGLASLLQKKPAPIANPMAWQSDPNSGLPIVAGRAYTSGKIFLRTVSGDNNNAESIHTCYSIGPVKGFEQLYVDSIARSIDVSDNVSVPDYGKVVIATQLGTQPEPSAFGFWDSTPGLTSASKVSGLAAAAIRLYYDTKGKNTMTTEPAIGFVVQGVRVYDPRQDSTYPGGAAGGTQRWNDETTWSYAGYDNPYLFALAWLIGWRQNGKLVAGVGMPVSAIILDQFVEGANVADANKWTMGGVLDTTDDKWNRLKDILQAGGGVPMRLGAQVGCIVNTPKTSLATITIDDVVGDATVQATQAQRDRINAIVPRYMAELDNTVADPSQPADSNGNYKLITNVTWAMTAASPVVVSDYVTFDGKQRQKQVDYAFVQNLTQAQQLARYDIENAREFGPISLPLKLRWMGYKPGDVVTCDLPELGLNGQDILLLQRELSPADLTVTMTARSETAAKHAYALGQTGTPPTTPSVTGPALIPVPGNAAWKLIGGTVTSDNGTTIPVLEVIGAADSTVIDAVVFQYRTSETVSAAAGAWVDAGSQPPTIEQFNIAGLKDGGIYDVSVAYRKQSATGDPLILGPATCGQTAIPYQTGVVGDKPPADADNTATAWANASGGITIQQTIVSIDSLTATAQDLVATYGDTASAAAAADAAQAAQSAAEQADSDATARAVAADGSASSAAGQASIATTQAQAAGSSASAAQAYSIAANGYAANALSSASAAGSYAASAGSNAAAAQQSATLSATIGPGTLNPNPSFASWTDPTSSPDSWSAWNYNGGTPVRVSGLDAVPYSCHFDATANNDCGIQQTFNQAAGKYIVEVTADLTAGTWDGAGVILQWYNLSGGQLTYKSGQSLSFLTATDTAGYVGNNGARRSWSMYVDTGVDGSINYFALYAIANYSGFGAAESGKGVTFRSLRVRAASAAEIAGQQALPLANSAIAQISTESSVRASADAALSSRVDTVNSSVGSLSSSVTSLSATTNNLSSRVSTAIFQVSAQAGTSRGLFKISADGFGSSEIDLVAGSINLWSQDGSNAIEALGINSSGLVTIPNLAAQQISTQHLVVAGVTTDRLAGNAVTALTAANLASGTVGDGTPYQSDNVSVSCTGNAMLVRAELGLARSASGTGALTVGLYRSFNGGSATLLKSVMYRSTNNADGSPISFTVIDSPGAGTCTYYLLCSISSGGTPGTYQVTTPLIVAQEFKR